jgi:polyhydroxyalkanoate synthesis regulator phasin
MGKRFGTVTLTVGIAAGALAGVAVGAPLLANAAGTTPSPSASAPAAPGQNHAAEREAAIKAALKSLVDDGTITQAQADKVASKLAGALPPRGRDGDLRGGMGGMRDLVQGGLDAAAKALGMTSDQVRQGLQSGKSLADLAKEKGVATSKLVDALVAEANTRIDQAVKDGKLTAAQAAPLKAGAKDRITAFVDGRMPMPGGRHGFGPGGFGPGGMGGGGMGQGGGTGSTNGSSSTT